MRQAADFLIGNPDSIDKGATAADTIAALIDSDTGVDRYLGTQKAGKDNYC
jgi:hypothetical protein